MWKRIKRSVESRDEKLVATGLATGAVVGGTIMTGVVGVKVGVVVAGCVALGGLIGYGVAKGMDVYESQKK